MSLWITDVRINGEKMNIVRWLGIPFRFPMAAILTLAPLVIIIVGAIFTGGLSEDFIQQALTNLEWRWRWIFDPATYGPKLTDLDYYGD